MVSVVAIVIWRIHPVIVLVGFLVFGSLDGLYLSSALTKVPSGAWFTLMLTTILSIVLFVWRYGKEQQWQAEMSNRVSLGQLVTVDEGGKVYLSPGAGEGGGELTEIKGLLSLPSHTGVLNKLRTLTWYWHLRRTEICRLLSLHNFSANSKHGTNL
jgi:KUP system potassium uptake protein